MFETLLTFVCIATMWASIRMIITRLDRLEKLMDDDE